MCIVIWYIYTQTDLAAKY